jgi:hypothetical protein
MGRVGGIVWLRWLLQRKPGDVGRDMYRWSQDQNTRELEVAVGSETLLPTVSAVEKTVFMKRTCIRAALLSNRSGPSNGSTSPRDQLGVTSGTGVPGRGRRLRGATGSLCLTDGWRMPAGEGVLVPCDEPTPLWVTGCMRATKYIDRHSTT